MIACMEEGEKAIDFSLPDAKGKIRKLSEWKGKKIALYFYPHDFTPGCTKQSCSLRDGFQALQKAGITIIGVNKESQEKHARFIEAHSLPFVLLSDETGKTCEAYKVWKQRNFYGNLFFGIQRTTFLIDEHFKVKKILKKIDTAEHAREVLDGFAQ
jgi:thioredoxin-dependent peroxiredoxin